MMQREFEGHGIREGSYKGRRFWVARDVGRALGYGKDGASFLDRLQEWADELEPGKDFEVVQGEELRTLKELIPEFGTSRMPSLKVLFESGMWIALTRTTMDPGKRMRRKFADEWAPQIARDGRYLPERSVDDRGQLVGGDSERIADQEHAARLAELRVEQTQADAIQLEAEAVRLKAEAERLRAEAELRQVERTSQEVGLAQQRQGAEHFVDLARIAVAAGAVGLAGEIRVRAAETALGCDLRELRNDFGLATTQADANEKPEVVDALLGVESEAREEKRRATAAGLGELAEKARALNDVELAAELDVRAIETTIGVDLGDVRQRIVAAAKRAAFDAKLGEFFAGVAGTSTAATEPKTAAPTREPPMPEPAGPAAATVFYPQWEDLERDGWVKMSHIARALECDAATLGKVARPLGLKNGPHSQKYWVKAPDGDWHQGFVYDDTAAGLIEAAWKKHLARAAKRGGYEKLKADIRAKVFGGRAPKSAWTPTDVAERLGTSRAGVGRMLRKREWIDDTDVVVKNGARRYRVTALGVEMLRQALSESRGVAA